MSSELPIRTKEPLTWSPRLPDDSPSSTSSTEPEDADVMTPAPLNVTPKAHRAPNTLTARGPRDNPNAGPASSSAAKPRSNVLTGLEVLLGTASIHPQRWTMPDEQALRATFVPEVASSLAHIQVYSDGTCFCSFALQTAQRHIDNTTSIDLQRPPINRADFIATLRRFLTDATVELFEADCDRYEETFGLGIVGAFLEQNSVAHHVGTMLEDLARYGITAITGPSEPSEHEPEPERPQSPVPGQLSRWKRFKKFFKEARDRTCGKTDESRHDSSARKSQLQRAA